MRTIIMPLQLLQREEYNQDRWSEHDSRNIRCRGSSFAPNSTHKQLTPNCLEITCQAVLSVSYPLNHLFRHKFLFRNSHNRLTKKEATHGPEVAGLTPCHSESWPNYPVELFISIELFGVKSFFDIVTLVDKWQENDILTL